MIDRGNDRPRILEQDPDAARKQRHELPDVVLAAAEQTLQVDAGREDPAGGSQDERRRTVPSQRVDPIDERTAQLDVERVRLPVRQLEHCRPVTLI
jgi:hypothetical protein